MDDQAYTPYFTPEMIEEQAWQDALKYRQITGGKMDFPLFPDEVLKHLWQIEVEYEADVRDAAGKPVLASFDPRHRIVLLNTEMRANEGQVSYSLAHEAGHVSLHEFLTRLGDEKVFCSPVPLSEQYRENIIESHADQYASAFLMPKDAVIHAVTSCGSATTVDLAVHGKKLTRLFGVSHQALEIRLARLGIVARGGFYPGKRRTPVRSRELDAIDEERATWSLYS